MTQDDIQNEALETLKNDKRLVLQWATGVGKGTLAVKAVDRLRPEKTLLVVAETAHKQNWKNEFIKFKVGELFDLITVECYASLKNYRETEWDLIIFDEAHHLASELRSDILQSLKAERVLALSATLSDVSLLYTLESTFGKFSFSEITMQEAIDLGFLPKPKVFLIPLTLDTKERNQIIVEEWGTSAKRKAYECSYPERWKYLKAKKTLYPNVTLTIHCTAYEKYCWLSEQFSYWQKMYFRIPNDVMKNKWLQFGSKRKAFLGSLKTPYAKRLLETIKDKRFICFCTDINQALELGGKQAIHSKNSNEENKNIINSFNERKIDSIFAVGMLQEGQNLPGIEVGVIVQLDGKERAFVQKFGRSMRAEDPVQYIFYYKNTKDEEYLNNVVENISKEYITEISL